MMWRGWCPCPKSVELKSCEAPLGRCSRGGQHIFKSQSHKDVVEAVFNHVRHSPFHNLEEDEARQIADGATAGGFITGAEESRDGAEGWVHVPDGAAAAAGGPRDEAQQQQQQEQPAAKVPKLMAAPRTPPGVGPLALASGSQTPMRIELTASELARPAKPLGGMVQMRSSEVAIILDSLKRAAANVRQAERVCEGAAASFRMEAAALEAAHAQLSMQFSQHGRV